MDKKAGDIIEQALEDIKPQFREIEKIEEENQIKVLRAMQKNKLSEAHFFGTTGYGYNDLGREVLESIYCHMFKAENAIVRPQLISGTHALSTALFGCLRHGDELLSPVGKPYDTLLGVIGVRKTKGSLIEHGVIYKQVDLSEEGLIDYDKIKGAINQKTRLVTIQRSKGYAFRHSFTVEEIKDLIKFIKNIKSDVICMVDNCYGEFVDYVEPYEVGADLVVGSLIKNPGGGLAPVGGYIVGKNELVEDCAVRLSAPGLGKEVGATLGVTKSMLQGLFFAPSVVAASLKGAVFAARALELLDYEVLPRYNEKRGDIVQAIKLGSPEKLISFCREIQYSSPVDSFVTLEPTEMPGYDSKIIMASGSFVSGSSIELSADAPIREPYIAYLQGGLTWSHCKYGITNAIRAISSK